MACVFDSENVSKALKRKTNLSPTNMQMNESDFQHQSTDMKPRRLSLTPLPAEERLMDDEGLRSLVSGKSKLIMITIIMIIIIMMIITITLIVLMIIILTRTMMRLMNIMIKNIIKAVIITKLKRLIFVRRVSTNTYTIGTACYGSINITPIQPAIRGNRAVINIIYCFPFNGTINWRQWYEPFAITFTFSFTITIKFIVSAATTVEINFNWEIITSFIPTDDKIESTQKNGIDRYEFLIPKLYFFIG